MKRCRLKVNPEKVLAWLRRSHQKLATNRLAKKQRKSINQVSLKRKQQNEIYSKERPVFLEKHPVCPVTGRQTTQIHHSAKREGGWLLLQRYWIAVSAEGHRWIEDNGKEAEAHGLVVRIHQSYDSHVASLEEAGISLTKPIFYLNWNFPPII